MRAPMVIVVAAAGLVALALLSPATAVAQVPRTMNYQVMLTDINDQPLPGSHNMVFRIYTQHAGGTLLWSESLTLEANSIGVVSAVLGGTNPINIRLDGEYWLEVEADGEIMAPRRRLTSAPYALQAADSESLANVAAEGYATDAELAASGTVNDPGNPVDWTMLKNVPAGFADGIDNTGGGGADGHSLDASDGDPVDAVYVDEFGKVGIGTTDPDRNVQVHSDDGNPCYQHFTHYITGTTQTDGLVIGTEASGKSYLYSYEDGILGLGTNNKTMLILRPDDTVDIGDEYNYSGELDIFRIGVSSPQIQCYTDAYGGYITVSDEAGNDAVVISADDNGTGGYIRVARDATPTETEGIALDGNWNLSGEPALSVMGSTSSARFNMTWTGNASVDLPADAIYDNEIMDEPGVASETLGSGAVALTGATSTILSRSINVPASGYVLAMASCQIQASHNYGSFSSANLGVSDVSGSLPANQDVLVQLADSLRSGTYCFPGTYHGLFEVIGLGTRTFYFLGQETAGAFTILDIQFSLMYFPTAYGTVEPTLATGSPGVPDEAAVARAPLTDADIAAERAEAEAFGLARIERELAEIQAQLDAMRATQKQEQLSLSDTRNGERHDDTSQPSDAGPLEPVRPAVLDPGTPR